MKSYNLLALLAMALLLAVLLAAPGYALKVYSNPSVQSSNTSPDGTYNEGNSMQVVSDYFVNRCSARGFGTRDSNWLSIQNASSDAVAWDADVFIAEHTDAAGTGGWNSNHGTHGFYYENSSGWYDVNERNLCIKCVDRCVDQFAAYGRGAIWGAGYQGDLSFIGFNYYVLKNTPGMDSVLIEGLFHTNYDDTQLLKSDAGKQAYAEGLFRGVCDQYGYSYSTLNSQYSNQSYTANLTPGQQAVVWVDYLNNGGVTWTNSGANPVRLGTWNPQDRSSVFYTAGNWTGPNRPSEMDQASVAPGQVGRFSFIMTGPVGNYGYKQEHWRLVKEMVAWFGFDGVWFGVNANPFDVVVDNSAAAFTASANWSTGTMSSDKYGADYRWRATEAISDTANWVVNVPTAGNYDVYAWWTVGDNRAPSAAYHVLYNGGTGVANVNQQASGGTWNKLGRWNFNAGNNTVKLSCWATTGYIVVADAVRMVGPY